MAVGTVAGSLTAGRRAWRWAPERRVVALQVVMSIGLAVSALATARLGLLGLALVLPGAALGALFTTLYVVVDRHAPPGSGTRTFAWLVTANNGGLAAGAAIAGALSEAPGPSAGLWFAAACALAGTVPAAVAAGMSAHAPQGDQGSDASGVPCETGQIRARQGNGDRREGS
jgi:predicted MFS family arabinose efflux permease